jgi:dTDP-4-dehydrorhamnose reductase
MKKLLITGASGFLGWHLCQQAQADWQIYGTYHSHAVTVPGVTLVPIDLTDLAAVTQLVQQIQPDALIHTAALSKPNACESNPELSYQINVAASWHLAELCAERDIPCVFTSSEQVFDGRNPPYREIDPVNPINRYGADKAAAEAGMQARYPKVAICRMPLMFGVAPIADSFIQPWIKTLRAGGSINLFTDEIRTPVWGADAARGLLLALEQVKGILHLGGAERISRYDFGKLLAEVLQIPETQLTPCQQADVPMSAPRSADVSMDSSLAFSLGYRPLGIREALVQLKEQL